MSSSGSKMGEADGKADTSKLPDFDILWDYEHPGPTEGKFRELLPAAIDSLDISYLAELRTQIARADARAKKEEGPVYSSIGWNHFERTEYQEALFMFQKALQHTDQLGDPLKIRTAKWSLAKVLRVIEHTEEALDMQRKLFEEYQGEGKRNGYVYEEIAECLLVLGQEQEAQEWFAAAYAELSKDPRVARDQNRLNRLKDLGQVAKPRPTPA